MRRFGGCISTILLCCVIAGIYGILYNQFTYTISPEYYSLHLFREYNTDPAEYGSERLAAAVVGFKSSWGTGLLIGCGLALTCFIFDSSLEMKKYRWPAILIVLVTTALMGFAGYSLSDAELEQQGVDRYLVNELANPVEYINVRTIDRYSAVGACLGLLLASSFLFTQKAKANLLLAKFAT